MKTIILPFLVVFFVGLVFITLNGCNVSTANNFVAALDKAEQVYRAERQLYQEMRKIVIKSDIDKATLSKLQKADKAMQQADARLQELWNNEAIRRGQNIHKAIEITNSSLDLIKTAIKLLR